MIDKNRIIIITGPTGVGKTDLALNLTKKMPQAEIINADVGQLYKPLTIGTAKPDWQNCAIPHHLFDVIYEPVNFTAIEFREHVRQLIKEIKKRSRVPIIVGGSSFYINALFFPPQQGTDVKKRQYDADTETLWGELNAVDPKRAAEIKKQDRYRIERALDIWYSLGVMPSLYKPTFDPVAPASFIVVTRDIEELYTLINDRVSKMFKMGWIDEVKTLSHEWHEFLLKKKLIGYDDIVRYLRGEISSHEDLIAIIQQKTRNYAKRQLTFNRMLTKKFEERCNWVYTEWVNMTESAYATTAENLYRKLKEKGKGYV